jgi:hypothetical protein
MFGLSKNIDVSFFVGCEMRQISFDLHQLTFGFTNNITLSVEGLIKLSHKSAPEESRWKPGNVETISEFGKLLGSSIIQCQPHEDGSLTLVFNNGFVIIVFDSNDKYESYQISYSGKTIVV